MGYQALLFCPDEKTARTVTQVLTELEFSVEPCTEAFAAVKKLMGGHFDAVVVDCDNEQNAALLFKSAKNSMAGQASLAVAVVEGQAGVAKAFRIGANLVLTKPINVEQAKGTLRVAATGQEIALDEVARASWQTLSDDVAPGLAHKATHLCDRYTFPNGCHLAEVEIDPETGEVALDRYVIFDDFGRLLDPRITLGQVHGGVTQGIGQALLEQVLFDESGQALTGSLMDYALPRAADVPAFEGSLSQDFPSLANRLGVKGSGQAGAIASPATVMNAVMNALAPFGVRHLDMPATPARIWAAIQAGRKGCAD